MKALGAPLIQKWCFLEMMARVGFRCFLFQTPNANVVEIAPGPLRRTTLGFLLGDVSRYYADGFSAADVTREIQSIAYPILRPYILAIPTNDIIRSLKAPFRKNHVRNFYPMGMFGSCTPSLEWWKEQWALGNTMSVDSRTVRFRTM